MKPTELANLLDIKPVTVRSWSDVFRQFLSPTAGGGDGAHRYFVETDIRIMWFIKREKDAGRQADQIIATLGEMSEDQRHRLPMPTTQVEAEMAVVPAALVDETRRALLRENSLLQERIDMLEKWLEEERGGKEKVLRELSELNGELQRSLLLVELYESGRLKPNS